jgi:hypothetical protein
MMKIQIKTGIILAVTLVIGMVLGALIYGAVMQHRIKQRALGMRKPGGLLRMMEMDLGLDETQTAVVDSVLNRHHERMYRMRGKLRIMMDSLNKELYPHLTQEQIERLERGPFSRKGDRPFGPPPYIRDRPWGPRPGGAPPDSGMAAPQKN